MATLDELVQAGVLRRQRIALPRNMFEDRKLYVTPAFRKWLQNDVMKADPFYPTDAKPRYQAHDLILSFIAGKPFLGNALVKRMRPGTDDIYELKSSDLRFFGWFPTMDCFVAVVGDLFENLKADKSLYEKHRIDSIAFRREIDLDDPKYTPGAGEYGVISS